VGYTKRSDLEVVSLQSAEESMTRRGRIAESLIASERPELIDLFLTYQNEAMAARKFLDSSLIELDSGAEILEVGGGILALAIQLASEGFKVTTVEPVGEGFSDISWIMEIYSCIAEQENIDYLLIEEKIENCSFDGKFEFIFSINVMEHLHNPYEVITQLSNSLTTLGKYRFLCPNYDFPYEPHFAKWIWSRRKGSFYLKLSRASHSKDLYRSLNFITVKKLLTSTKKTNIEVTLNKNALFDLLKRASKDSSLRSRHKGVIFASDFINKTGLINLSRFIPTLFQPVMDVAVTLKDRNKVVQS
jgi:2-polyprenyl-3-methyl-5-hydroxy-6-metoxy-1,4-benzoquinol methylase